MTDETTQTPEIPPIAEPTPARPGALILTGTPPQAEPPAAEAPAPEAVVYTDFTLPEGMTPDAPAMKAAADLFRESGFSQETAQKFIDLATLREQQAASAGLKAFVDLQTKGTTVSVDASLGTAVVYGMSALFIELQSASTDLYGILTCVATPTFGTTSDIAVSIGIQQD